MYCNLNTTEELSDPLLCEHCLVEHELKWEIQERGTVVEKCPICHCKGGKAIAATDPKVMRIFRALIRLNFSEWDYNTHIGGDDLEGLIMASKAIFNLNESADINAFEEAFLAMEDGWYPATDEEISLGGGYWDGGILNGIRDQRDTEVEKIVRAALEQNWFQVEPATRALIENLRSDITAVIPAGELYYRARVGVKSRLSMRDPMPNQGRRFRYLPYTGKEIDSPPLRLATEGRFNRARVSLLYLASDVETAVAELRPHPGHIVSTAQFRLTRNVTVANFAHQDIRNYLSDGRLERLRCILSVADVLNVPVQPEHKVLYAVTQLFADALREAGFDGVTYSSSLGKGANLTCFLRDAFELVPESGGVQDVIGLEYKVKPSQVIAAEYDDETWTEDEDSPLAVLLHGMARRGP
jgi:hypothetical protein